MGCLTASGRNAPHKQMIFVYAWCVSNTFCVILVLDTRMTRGESKVKNTVILWLDHRNQVDSSQLTWVLGSSPRMTKMNKTLVIARE